LKLVLAVRKFLVRAGHMHKGRLVFLQVMALITVAAHISTILERALSGIKAITKSSRSPRKSFSKSWQSPKSQDEAVYQAPFYVWTLCVPNVIISTSEARSPKAILLMPTTKKGSNRSCDQQNATGKYFSTLRKFSSKVSGFRLQGWVLHFFPEAWGLKSEALSRHGLSPAAKRTLCTSESLPKKLTKAKGYSVIKKCDWLARMHSRMTRNSCDASSSLMVKPASGVLLR